MCGTILNNQTVLHSLVYNIYICKKFKAMTRINAHIKPKNLIDQHLLAELRELPRIPSMVVKYSQKDPQYLQFKSKIPNQFTLGKGHVLFFYDKIEYLYNRFLLLMDEYYLRYNREYSIDLRDTMIKNCTLVQKQYSKAFNDWSCDHKRAQLLLINRIKLRITESPQIPKYYRKSIEKSEALKILIS